MRKKIVAGNWKMNLNRNEAISLTEAVNLFCQQNYQELNLKNIDVVLAPPFVYLDSCSKVITNTKRLFISAQNCHTEEKGAYTGEISVPMLASLGISHVIIGHSERRILFHEDHEILATKVKAALKFDLIPVFCIGEVLSQREAEQHFEVIEKQLYESLFSLDVSDFCKVVIAYEPVWAIGTGITATPAQAQEMHLHIRKVIGHKYGLQVAENTSILYGGSCNAANSAELFSMPDVDGGLIGGASLKAVDFITIIQAVN